MLEHAHELLDRARRLILSRVERGFEVQTKADGSPVTSVDLEVEQMLREGLEERFPEHGIIGEEFPPHNPGADYQWYIDPIDGTHSFCAGIPLYGTILALHHRGRPELGLIDLPALGERYSASKGQGAWMNGKSIQVGEGVGEPIIATADRAQFQRVGREGALDRIMLRFPHVRAYSDCFGHAMAVRGSAGAMVDFGIRAWDLAASRVLVEEAGGRYEVVHQDGDRFCVILGRPAVVQAVLTCI